MSSIDIYCNEFLQIPLDVNSAAELKAVTNDRERKENGAAEYIITPGIASYMFIMETVGVA